MRIPTRKAYKLFQKDLKMSQALVNNHYDDAILSSRELAFNKRIKARGFKFKNTSTSFDKLDKIHTNRTVKKIKRYRKKGIPITW